MPVSSGPVHRTRAACACGAYLATAWLNRCAGQADLHAVHENPAGRDALCRVTIKAALFGGGGTPREGIFRARAAWGAGGAARTGGLLT